MATLSTAHRIVIGFAMAPLALMGIHEARFKV